MISEPNLEHSPQWAVIANEGIGGPVPYIPPDVYTVVPASPSNEWMIVAISGKGYTDMMAYLHRPLMPTFDPQNVPAYVDFEFTLMTDQNAPSKAQAIEFENCFGLPSTDNGKTTPYGNGSLQINYNVGGELQAWAGPSNPWANTGINLGILVPETPYRFRVRYLINFKAATLSTVYVAVNDVLHYLPEQFQNVPAIVKDPGWAPGVYCQFQLDLAYAGGAFSVCAKDVGVNWL